MDNTAENDPEQRSPPDRRQRRKRQSAKARELALHLLNDGIEPGKALVGEILRDSQGRPVFPGGKVGSLSHSGDHVAAAIANQRDWDGVGIDIEPAKALPRLTPSVILTDAETRQLAVLTKHGDYFDRLIFCAKECVYKVIEPLTGIQLGFQDVEVKVEHARKTFRILPRSEAAHRVFESGISQGAYELHDGQILAILALRKSD